jgi:hypothetical protein
MKTIGEFLRAVLSLTVYAFIIGLCAAIWISLAVLGGLIMGLAVIFLAGLAAAIAHNKGKGFIMWLLWGTLFPGIALIAAIAIRRPPVAVYIMKEP